MHTITYSDARAHLADTMDQVCSDHAPILITRERRDPVVMISLADYHALQETSYLLRSPKNARRLLAAVDQLGAKRGKKRSIKV